MSTIHIVEEGEHLSGIAAKFGFSSFRTLFDHPENAELKKKRKNPNILTPGDRVFIPDREQKEESRATEKLSRFELLTEELQLRVKVLNLSEQPLSGPCFLAIGLDRNQMQESGRIFLSRIASDVKKAAMEFDKSLPDNKPAQKFPLAVGGIDDIKDFSGQQQRLNNLAYFAGFSEKSKAQFKWAVEEFQADHLKEIGITKPTGECDAKTQKILEKVHGV